MLFYITKNGLKLFYHIWVLMWLKIMYTLVEVMELYGSILTKININMIYTWLIVWFFNTLTLQVGELSEDDIGF